MVGKRLPYVNIAIRIHHPPAFVKRERSHVRYSESYLLRVSSTQLRAAETVGKPTVLVMRRRAW